MNEETSSTQRVNKFLFSWDMFGVEAIIFLNDYEDHDMDNTVARLKGEAVTRNPLDGIVFGVLIRARANSQRHYEVYVVNCDESMDTEFWKKQWEEYPQETADLIRERGHKLYGDRLPHEVKIR